MGCRGRVSRWVITTFAVWVPFTEAAVRSNREVKVPAGLIAELNDWYLREQRKLKPDPKISEAELRGELHRQLLDVEVRFEPLTGDAVSEVVRLSLPTGGAAIDMAEVVRGSRGGFKLVMEASKVPPESKLRVFYVSGARTKKIDGENYGAGCGKWMDVTSWYAHSQGEFEAYATGKRHIHVLAGSWVFAAIHGVDLWLGTVTFNDSRHPEAQCEGL